MLYRFAEQTPQVAATAFVAPSAVLLGNVQVGAHASIWYGSVLRGDLESIHIGAYSNVQDCSVVHTRAQRFATHVGAYVTIGHRVLLHGCTLADHILVGMGAIIMDGVQVGAESLVAAGALLTPGKVFPPRAVIMGAPARVVRQVTAAEIVEFRQSAQRYSLLAAQHRSTVVPIPT